MDDTHMAAEEDEGEEGHIPRTQSPPVTHSLTHYLASDQLFKREPVPELTSVAPRQHVSSPVTFPNDSRTSPAKPDNGAKPGANVTVGSLFDPKSKSHNATVAPEPTRTIIAKTPSDWLANGSRTPPLDDMPVPLKKIKVEEPWMWITEQAATQLCDDGDDDDVCEDPLSTLAAVVCLSVTERKGLQEKLFSSRSSILHTIKSEPPDLYFVKKEAEDFKGDACQKSSPLGPERTPRAIKEEPPAGVLQPSVQSLAEKRNLSFDQAIAIEALTQLAAIPQATPRPVKSEDKCERPVSSAALVSPSNSTLQDTKSAATTTAAQCNKVSVISSPRQQMSVIRPPVARQGSIIQCSQGSCPAAKTTTCHDPSRRTEHCFGSTIIKSECSYNDSVSHGKDPARHFGGANGPIADKERNRDEEEVAAQLVDLAFIIQTRHNLRPENSPPRGTPVSAIKYNYKSQQLPLSQKKPATKKPKNAPPKPRKKKADGQQEGLAGRTTPLKRTANGEMPHGGRGKKILQQGRSGLPHKRSLFLPQTQIDFKRYLAEAQEVRRQLIHHASVHTNAAPCGPQHQSNSSAPMHNGPLDQHHPCNGHSAAPGQEYGRYLLHEVGQAGAEDNGAGPFGLGSEHHGLANGFPRPPCSPPPSQQCYYKLEKSGSVTVLSTTTDGDLGHSAESTPSKNSIGTFLDSPMSFLDTPTKNLLNTPSKKLADLPSCQCMGEWMLSDVHNLVGRQCFSYYTF